jgi:choline/glycine/proline betaine transport protein
MSQARPPVFWWSAGLIAALLLLGVVATGTMGEVFAAVQTAVVRRLGGMYLLSMTAFLVVAVWLAVSPLGRIRLGPPGARPQFATLTWFSMLFSAGMGIGLLFFGVAEPMTHYARPPGGGPATPADAMGLTYFHWGLHPWGLYALVALGLAFAHHCHRRPLSLRWALHPLLGERVRGPIGDAIDVLAVVGTLFGVATSLGLGAVQINAGLAHIAGVPVSGTAQLVIIAVITAIATASVCSGLEVGVRRLSELNMGIAALLLVFLFIAGPTTFIATEFIDNLLVYMRELPSASVRGPEASEAWLGDWTIFYWAWWIAWAPFVGTFIARISRGRTVRELVLGVLLAPSLAGFVWLGVWGDAALHEELFGAGGIASAVTDSRATAVFVLLERHPFAAVTTIACTLCIALFFVTSSDSASLVVDMLASGGNPEPPIAQRVFWAVLEGVAAAILLVSGGLAALQSAALSTAAPLCLVTIAMTVALVIGLRRASRSACNHGSS